MIAKCIRRMKSDVFCLKGLMMCHLLYRVGTLTAPSLTKWLLSFAQSFPLFRGIMSSRCKHSNSSQFIRWMNFLLSNFLWFHVIPAPKRAAKNTNAPDREVARRLSYWRSIVNRPAPSTATICTVFHVWSLAWWWSFHASSMAFSKLLSDGILLSSWLTLRSFLGLTLISPAKKQGWIPHAKRDSMAESLLDICSHTRPSRVTSNLPVSINFRKLRY